MRKRFYLNGNLKAVITLEELERHHQVIIEDTLPGYLPEEVASPFDGQSIYDRDEGSVKIYLNGRWVQVVA